MAEQESKTPSVPSVPKVPKVPEAQKGFTKMRNISNQTLQLASGALLPKKVTEYNAAEFSTLHMFLEGVE